MILHHGDCREVMATLPENSVDTIITDPPYGLSFMGKGWDQQVPGADYWRAALRVAKPGAMLLAFGGTRTWHHLATAIEQAGWEIRDSLMWLYGTGFPKSHNLNGDFKGWGTALKPAWEPIILAMKPCDETFEDNARKHGVAGLAIDAGRIGSDITTTIRSGHSGDHGTYSSDNRKFARENPPGRWPANVILDEEAAAALDEQAIAAGARCARGDSGGRSTGQLGSNGIYGGAYGHTPKDVGYGDGQPGASRFFYCAKASRSERGEGNDHPTVKPLALMRYLCRLTKTPTGGVVLDPFMGSGSTGVAAIQEGREFIGIEMDAHNADIARGRLAGAA